MSVSQKKLGQMLESFSTMADALSDLTEEEVLAALELEAASQRRRSVIDRLIKRAVRLNELKYQRHLKEKFNGTQKPDPR